MNFLKYSNYNHFVAIVPNESNGGEEAEEDRVSLDSVDAMFMDSDPETDVEEDEQSDVTDSEGEKQSRDEFRNKSWDDRVRGFLLLP